MPYRTQHVMPPQYRVGDKVIAHTKPWSPDNIHGHGHHELWNQKVGTVIAAYDNHYWTGGYWYWIKFFHCTYVAALTEDEMEHFYE